MGVLSSSIETRIKLVRIMAEVDGVEVEITEALYDGGLLVGEPSVYHRKLRLGRELVIHIRGGIQ